MNDKDKEWWVRRGYSKNLIEHEDTVKISVYLTSKNSGVIHFMAKIQGTNDIPQMDIRRSVSYSGKGVIDTSDLSYESELSEFFNDVTDYINRSNNENI